MTWDPIRVFLKAAMRDLLVCLALALVFTFLGVYDSDGMAGPSRLAFWSVIMCIGGLFIVLIEPLIFGKFLKNAHPSFQILVIAAIISIPITVFLAGLNTQFQYHWPFINWVMQYIGVMILSVIIVTGRYVMPHLLKITKSENADLESSPTDQKQKFLSRLPVKYRSAKLWALSSEGHYLRVHTDRGSPLILMRISDAVRELDGSGGLQVHRSWWVAPEGLQDTERVKGRRFLILLNGEKVPVSRSYLPALKAANLD